MQADPRKPMSENPTALLLVAEKWKGTVTMATTELPNKVEKDDTPQPFSKNFDRCV